MGGRPWLVNRLPRLSQEPTIAVFSTGGGGFSLAQPGASDKSDLESQLYYWHITVEAIEVICRTTPQNLAKILTPPDG